MTSKGRVFSAVRLIAKALAKVASDATAVALLRVYFGGKTAVLETREGDLLCVDIHQDLSRVLSGADHKRFNKNNFFPAIDGMIERGSLVFDVGASHGLEVLYFSRQVGDEGLVVALEPNPVSFEALKTTIHLNSLRNVLPLNLGAGSERGFVAAKPRMRGQDFTVRARGVEDDVEVRTLDDIYEEHGRGLPVSFIKSDTDGFELEVVRGARKIIEDFPDVAILAEYTPAVSYSGRKGVDPLRDYRAMGLSLSIIRPQISPLDDDDFESFAKHVNDPRYMICHDIVLRRE